MLQFLLCLFTNGRCLWKVSGLQQLLITSLTLRDKSDSDILVNFFFCVRVSVLTFFLCVKSRETDNNLDGRADELSLKAEVPMNPTENVVSVQLVLFFYYKLLVDWMYFHLTPFTALKVFSSKLYITDFLSDIEDRVEVLHCQCNVS
jgi:hypothetical protein